MSAQECFRIVLKCEMEKQDISVQNLAEHLGVNPQIVESYLLGSSVPRLATLVAISKFLNITTDYLLGVKDEFGNKLQHSPNRQKRYDNPEQ